MITRPGGRAGKSLEIYAKLSIFLGHLQTVGQEATRLAEEKSAKLLRSPPKALWGTDVQVSGRDVYFL